MHFSYCLWPWKRQADPGDAAVALLNRLDAAASEAMDLDASLRCKVRWNTMGTLAVKQYAISDTIPCTIAEMDKFGMRHRTRSAILHNGDFFGCWIARFFSDLLRSNHVAVQICVFWFIEYALIALLHYARLGYAMLLCFAMLCYAMLYLHTASYAMAAMLYLHTAS